MDKNVCPNNITVHFQFQLTVTVTVYKCEPNGPDRNIRSALSTTFCHVDLGQLAMMMFVVYIELFFYKTKLYSKEAVQTVRVPERDKCLPLIAVATLSQVIHCLRILPLSTTDSRHRATDDNTASYHIILCKNV
ncbi:hypothetical protein KIN20_008944 [Parelaphostrongylus tenuis]|uniref:Uncharacterized protein n=1 Tax=Parelaphostrongylus tenuis TaxID=148309 RepID=A0AAD5MX73_PARTN|nr:hypothetical protein KIN20_008944 [Parelaphostrongylus tenuis]